MFLNGVSHLDLDLAIVRFLAFRSPIKFWSHSHQWKLRYSQSRVSTLSKTKWILVCLVGSGLDWSGLYSVLMFDSDWANQTCYGWLKQDISFYWACFKLSKWENNCCGFLRKHSQSSGMWQAKCNTFKGDGGWSTVHTPHLMSEIWNMEISFVASTV